MKARLMWTLAVVGALSGLVLAQSAPNRLEDGVSAREKFVGAWRLAWIGRARVGRDHHSSHRPEGRADVHARWPHFGADTSVA